MLVGGEALVAGECKTAAMEIGCCPIQAREVGGARGERDPSAGHFWPGGLRPGLEGRGAVEGTGRRRGGLPLATGGAEWRRSQSESAKWRWRGGRRRK